MQAKNLSDYWMLLSLDRAQAKKSAVGGPCEGVEDPWVFTYELHAEVGEHIPWKVVNAKCASMIRRGLLDGCTCGCRGDFCRP